MIKSISIGVSTLLVAISINACGSDKNDKLTQNETKKSEISFRQVEVPTTQTLKNTQQVSKSVRINDKEEPLSYTTILRTGDKNNGEIFGRLKDYQDKPLSFKDGSIYVCNGTNEGIGSGLDFTSFINKNGNIYMVSQFECQIGGMYMVQLNQDAKSGKLSPKENSMKFISQKSEFGGFVHCAGQKTPWNSHLSSEEYEPDARAVEKGADATTGLTGNKYYDEVAKYWGGNALLMSPYYYGWTPEVTLDDKGSASYTKHYAMGRMSHELSYVMPDEKTVYMSDDGTNVGIYMFIADTKGDLSAGTIYAAKWKQTSSKGAGAADISWINLGHATNSEIRAYLDPDNNVNTNDALKFSDIFQTAQANSDNSCPSGFVSVNTSAYHECLKIKTGMQKAASRLETRRYAAIKGATTELRKEEGITYDANSKKLFIAMSSIERGMEDNKKAGKDNTKYDIGGNNDIKLSYNPCGAVYSLDVSTKVQKDNLGNNIDSSYVVNNMYSIVEGEAMKYDATSEYAGNKCNVNKISNPDNISFLQGTNILTIGEDTSKHQNNMIWNFDIKQNKLTRIGTAPVGAEVTSTDWYRNLKNGFGYFPFVTQHPDSKTTDLGQSSIGYIGVFKNLDK